MKSKKKVYKSRIKKLERAKYRASKKEDKLLKLTTTLHSKTDKLDDDDDDPISDWRKLADKDGTPELLPVIEEPLFEQDEDESSDSWYNVATYIGNPNPSIDITYDLFDKFDLLLDKEVGILITLIINVNVKVTRSLIVDPNHTEAYIADNEKYEGAIAHDRAQFVAGAIDISGQFEVVDGEPVLYIPLSIHDINPEGILFLSIFTCGRVYFLDSPEGNDAVMCYKGIHAKYIWNMVKNYMHNGLLWLKGYNMALECFPYEDSIAACNWPYEGYNSDGILIDKDSLIAHLLGIVWLSFPSQIVYNFLISEDGEEILHYIINGVWYKLPEGFPLVGYTNKYASIIYDFSDPDAVEYYIALLADYSETINSFSNEEKIRAHSSINK